MKKLLVFTLVLCQLLCACTYHGQIRRGIYHHRDYKDKINARVMVVSDKFFPRTETLDMEDVYSYHLEDGLPVAVADALGTLFTEVEVNEDKYRTNYDFIVEIDFDADAYTRIRRYVRQRAMFPRYYALSKMRTTLTLTVRNPHTGYAIARYEKETNRFIPSPRTDTTLWLTSALRMATLGILTPLDLQVFGGKLRRHLEKDITTALSKDIMPRMKDDRINFLTNYPTERTNTRVDGQLLPFMQATVFIMADEWTGSGFLIDPRGYIITNAHVVDKNRDVSVVLYDERHKMDKTTPLKLPSPDTLRNKVRFAKVLKVNKTRDLALLKIEGENFPWLALQTDRSAYVTGRNVLAIGAPRNIEWTVTKGIISAVRDNNGVDTIQTDVAINGGNSGGPLLDEQTGKVIGVNSWGQISNRDIPSLQRGTHGLNFAISAFEVQRTLGITQPVRADDFEKSQD